MPKERGGGRGSPRERQGAQAGVGTRRRIGERLGHGARRDRGEERLRVRQAVIGGRGETRMRQGD